MKLAEIPVSEASETIPRLLSILRCECYTKPMPA